MLDAETVEDAAPPDAATADDASDAHSPPTAPYVLSVSPAHGAKGVTVDTPIVVTFSRAMDEASVVAAFASDSLPAADLAFSMDETGTVLRIDTSGVLAYAKSESLAVPAYVHAFSIGASATDTLGVPMAHAFASSFSVARLIIHTLPLVVGTVGSSYAIPDVMRAGDGANDAAMRAVATFDASYFAGTTVVSVHDATLSLSIEPFTGTPFSLGAFGYEHVTFASLDEAFSTVALGELAPLTTEFSVLDFERDIGEILADDLANAVARGHRVQLRFRFEAETDADHGADVLAVTGGSVHLDALVLVE